MTQRAGTSWGAAFCRSGCSRRAPVSSSPPRLLRAADAHLASVGRPDAPPSRVAPRDTRTRHWRRVHPGVDQCHQSDAVAGRRRHHWLHIHPRPIPDRVLRLCRAPLLLAPDDPPYAESGRPHLVAAGEHGEGANDDDVPDMFAHLPPPVALIRESSTLFRRVSTTTLESYCERRGRQHASGSGSISSTAAELCSSTTLLDDGTRSNASSSAEDLVGMPAILEDGYARGDDEAPRCPPVAELAEIELSALSSVHAVADATRAPGAASPPASAAVAVEDEDDEGGSRERILLDLLPWATGRRAARVRPRRNLHGLRGAVQAATASRVPNVPSADLAHREARAARRPSTAKWSSTWAPIEAGDAHDVGGSTRRHRSLGVPDLAAWVSSAGAVARTPGRESVFVYID